MSTDEAKASGIHETDRFTYIRVDSTKVNITKPTGAAKWFKLIGVHLGNETDLNPNGDEVQTVEVWSPPSTWADLPSDLLNQILNDIDAGLTDGNRYSDGPNVGNRAAWKVVQKHAPQKTDDQCREVVKTWVKNGLLIRTEYENPTTYKKVIGLSVDSGKRPS